MHHFKRRGNELYAEEVPIREIAKEVGTPFYLYSHATLKRHFWAFDSAFSDIPHITCYSVKVCSNIAILALFRELGAGADIVSGGELFRSLKAGYDPKRIVYSGVGKTREEIRYALEKGILMFNVESIPELYEINEVARELDQMAPISIRVNPDVDPKTHPYISTGLKKNKFGISREKALQAYKIAQALPNLNVVGIDCHIGSQLTDTSPFVDALKRLMDLIEELKKDGIYLKYVDIGGGLGITYMDEVPPSPEEYANALIEELKGKDLTLILEPGRVIAGNAGTLISKVLYVKEGEDKNFIIVDAAMNDLIRPSLYGSYHHIEPVITNRDKKIKADIVGPICESTDFLAKDRDLEAVEKGDLLCVFSAGAYGFAMSSNYNSRPRAAEVMVIKDRFYVIREREGYEDLIRGEVLPDDIGQ